MFSRKRKLALEDLHSLLASWSTSVPARARRFQVLRSDLDRRVMKASARWWLSGEGELATLRQQVEQLGELAPSLAALIAQAEADEKEVIDLRARAERQVDRALAGWLTDRCVEWQSTLRRLGAYVEREPERERDAVSLTETGDLVHRHANALRRLDEAQQYLDRLGVRMETAALQADLPLLRQRLLAEGASPAWLTEIERVVSAVRAVVDVPPEKPPETLQQVEELLVEARGWERALDCGDRTSHLRERHLLAEKGWEQLADGEIQDLLQKAGEARADLRRTAAERRAAALARLSERSLQLASACGSNPDLEREINALRTAEAGDPDVYKDWMERQATVDRRLLAVAGSNIGLLQAHADKLRQDLGARLEKLRRESLSGPAIHELERLSLDIANLPDFDGDDLEPLFESLGSCSGIAAALAALAARVRAEREVLEATQQRLLARHRSLRQEVARSGLELIDLEPRIAGLAAAEPGASLDDLRQQAEALELELAAREKEFAARCAAWLAEHRLALRGAVEILHLLGRSLEEPPDPAAGGGIEHAQVARAVAEMRHWETALAQEMERVWQDLAERGRKVVDEMAALPLNALRREELDSATELGRRLATTLGDTEASLEDRLRTLFEILESADTFQAKLSEDERSARRRAEALRLRLRELNDSGLDRFCPPDLVVRASALVHGIPDEPLHWGSVADQLAVAEDLLESLEDHARRCAAADLARGIATLERRLQTTVDPAFAGRARGLLAQLERWGHDRIAPVMLRMQVRMLASDAGGGER